MTYTLVTVKGRREINGDLMAALDAALDMEEELQPAYGVTVTRDGETIAEVRDGAIDGRTPDAWWAWHDANQSHWSADVEHAEARCAAWLIGESDDGPEI